MNANIKNITKAEKAPTTTEDLRIIEKTPTKIETKTETMAKPMIVAIAKTATTANNNLNRAESRRSQGKIKIPTMSADVKSKR